jgi:two-component system nitrogen regulation response regulator GlnG
MTTVLLADDDASLRFVLSQALGKEGFQVRATNNVATLARWVKDGDGDVVVSDVFMGDDCVFDTLPSLRAGRPALPVIVMSAQSTVNTALSAAGVGAFDYIPKPFDLDDLLSAVKRAVSPAPAAKARALSAHAEREERLPLVGRSAAMQDVYRVMARVAATDLPVLVEGEPGVGKTRVAQALHQFGKRKDGKFKLVSVAGASDFALGEILAAEDVTAADTLAIADIDDLPADGQARLVRWLMQRDDQIPANQRLICMSQRPLGALAAAGQFRQDLYFRLSVVVMALPPLRERLDDIGDLARAFLVRLRKNGAQDKTLEPAAIEALKRHSWPGNVRELENFLRRLVALRPQANIDADVIAQDLLEQQNRERPPAVTGEASLSELVGAFLAAEFAAAGGLPPQGLYDRVMADVERPLLSLTLKATRGNQIKAAAVLGINRNTLRKKLQDLRDNGLAAD